MPRHYTKADCEELLRLLPFRDSIYRYTKEDDKGNLHDEKTGEFVSKGKSEPKDQDIQAWQGNRSAWEKAGMPFPDISALERSAEAEQQAIKDFLSIFPDPVAAARSGVKEPDPSTFAESRDETFAAQINAGKGSSLPSKTPLVPRLKRLGAPHNGEDARLAIAIGRRLGYRDEDIARYLFENYIPHGDKILAGKRKG